MPMHPAAPDDLAGLVDSFASSINALIDLAITCHADDFDKPTDCPGWTVKDQFAHVAATESRLLGRTDPDVEVPDHPHLRHPRARAIEAGVEVRRSRTGAEVVEELKRVAAARIGRLHETDLDPDETVVTPMGEMPRIELVRRRAIDVWVHEQDVRHALGRPGNLDAAGASIFCQRVIDALPQIVLDSGVEPGKVVMIELTGPVVARTGVRVERAPEGETGPVASLMFSGGVDETGPIPVIGKTTSIQMSTDAFTRRAAGRRSVDDLHYTVHGDQQVAREVLENLVVTR
ncbi:maleylpyruvate isomerase family mycothiol-dependent enzyme [Agilicoccus flavus]|uniref:maleylpyruvate isomerase family mycothiol-dependent enzyme n=1 Tax=Agilicoccus flavus TaxID=2775968 RepID=UPI001CF6263E|nr:maleylpyruvate isomerase family mycothiol-dependent enzyme [Agilicoccus flavus]